MEDEGPVRFGYYWQNFRARYRRIIAFVDRAELAFWDEFFGLVEARDQWRDGERGLRLWETRERAT